MMRRRQRHLFGIGVIILICVCYSFLDDTGLESTFPFIENIYRLYPSLYPPSDVIIVSYLRGGTTFLGEMLGFKKGNFYVYEPLHQTLRFGYYDTGVRCTMLNESCSRSNDTDKILDVIRGIYNCDSQKYHRLLKPWHYMKSMGPSQRQGCVVNAKFIERPYKYLNHCLTAESKVSKIPRISMGVASKLLSEFPNLKIIHLLRDPRAIINSVLPLGWKIPPSGGAASLCNKMTKDFREGIKIKQAYPGRVYTVFYEDLAQNPSKVFSSIYKFLGYRFSSIERHRLVQMTASTKDGYANDTRRHDSTKTARKWRYKINSTVLVKINKACSSLYKLLGYPRLESISDLNNADIPLRYDEDCYKC
ncbi:carbohydrate sulfotransferase 1-like [Argopecten irradians]|uniref:carbohydrate sulfotransferase 1-like n=1 Tax=Argopecten irradians TaxID=31199 RepID=UPI00371F6A7B